MHDLWKPFQLHKSYDFYFRLRLCVPATTKRDTVGNNSKKTARAIRYFENLMKTLISFFPCNGHICKVGFNQDLQFFDNKPLCFHSQFKKKKERVPGDDYERQVYVSLFITNPTFGILEILYKDSISSL